MHIASGCDTNENCGFVKFDGISDYASPKLNNSKVLADLDSKLGHLSPWQKARVSHDFSCSQSTKL